MNNVGYFILGVVAGIGGTILAKAVVESQKSQDIVIHVNDIKKIDDDEKKDDEPESHQPKPVELMPSEMPPDIKASKSIIWNCATDACPIKGKIEETLTEITHPIGSADEDWDKYTEMTSASGWILSDNDGPVVTTTSSIDAILSRLNWEDNHDDISKEGSE